MAINAKYSMRLSIDSIEGFEQLLLEKKRELPQVAVSIVQRVSEVGLKNNYASTITLPVKNEGNKITGGIKTTDEKDTYKEFGTGIVGSNNPHVSAFLARAGWKYDVNEHGEKGWVYPKGDGTFGWTKGIPAQKKFYNAILEMQSEFPNIAKEEFNK